MKPVKEPHEAPQPRVSQARFKGCMSSELRKKIPQRNDFVFVLFFLLILCVMIFTKYLQKHQFGYITYNLLPKSCRSALWSSKYYDMHTDKKTFH